LAAPLAAVLWQVASALLIVFKFETAAASLAARREAIKFGMAMAAMMPMITTTIKSSISEKPF
jgi:hypothetical protein